VNTKSLLDSLLKLQSLEFDEAGIDGTSEKEIDKKIAALRLQIPLPILNHYDRLGARGKKGVAAVRHQTCTGCHVQVTKAVVINLMRGEDIQVCENCGRYLYLPEPDESKPQAAAQKTGAKLRKQPELSCAA
jgi:predicted  nucleic acid-binding Zn-ribbon protein